MSKKPKYVARRESLAETCRMLFRPDIDSEVVNSKVSAAWNHLMAPAADYKPRVLCYFDRQKLAVATGSSMLFNSVTVVEPPHRQEELVIVSGLATAYHETVELRVPVLNEYREPNVDLLMFSTQIIFLNSSAGRKPV